MDPAVTLLECWSTKTCKPIVFPIFAKWMFSLSDFCCLSLISFENSESLKIFLWLNEQHIPMSVGTGLNMSMQSISLPYKRHFFRSHSVSFIFWHGRLEYQINLNKLGKFLPISSNGKFSCNKSFIISFNLCISFLFVLLKNMSINGNWDSARAFWIVWEFSFTSLLFVFRYIPVSFKLSKTTLFFLYF